MSDITQYLNQIGVKKAKSGYDENGKPTISTGVNFPMRFREKQIKIRDYQGNEYVTDAEVWTEPDEELSLDSIIEYESEQYKVIKKGKPRNFEGKVHHKKFLVIRTKENA